MTDQILPRPIFPTPQKPDQLPSSPGWVLELLATLRGATKRLHPVPTVEQLEKKTRIKFFHAAAFGLEEREWIRTIIQEFATERGQRIGAIRVNSEWVYFDIPRRQVAASHQPG